MRIIIAAGGTGGHLYPGLALAREFERQVPGVEVIFVGTTRGLETKVMPREGFELITIRARGIMGKGGIGGLRGLAVIPLGLVQCLALCRTRRPDLVIGIGGYTSPPLVAAAFLLGIKRALLEPNAYPGVANRFMSPLANLVFVAFADAVPFFGTGKTQEVGTPIRRAFLEGTQSTGASRTHGSVLLILGGSQGARSINRAMCAAFPLLLQVQPELRLIHQTGERDFEEVAAAYRAAMQNLGSTGHSTRPPQARQDAPLPGEPEVTPFLYDMPSAMRQADLIVSRAGATTVAEITACGKPAILIPFPHAIHGHQERNARVLEQAGAAQVILDQQLSGDMVAQAIAALLGDRSRLARMGQQSRALGRPDSAERVVQTCRELIRQG